MTTNKKLILVTVNGLTEEFYTDKLSYEELMPLVGYEPTDIISVTYHAKLGKDVYKSGTLRPKQTLDLVDGMRISAVSTSNA